jgi:signal transduction histidine kinase
VEERTTQLSEANEQLNGFTYSLAHDFRQHIRSININAEIVLDEVGPSLGEYKENIERVGRAAKLMSRMADDLLSYARMRSIEMQMTPVDMTELAEEIAQGLQAAYPSAKYSIQPEMEVIADRTMLRLVLENLLDNAFKYSQREEAPFIELGQEDGRFFVRDNGIGFDMAFVDKLFKPFERLLPQSEFGGTGMGLANVKRILERHGGRIWVESEPAKGTTFHFVLASELGEGEAVVL